VYRSCSADCRLDDQVRSPAESKDFSSNLCVLTSSEAHPASCIMDTGGLFPGGKARLGRDTDHSPHLVPDQGRVRAIPPLPPWSCMTVAVQLLTYISTSSKSWLAGYLLLRDFGPCGILINVCVVSVILPRQCC
jgi:hypothetical protein